MGAWKNRMFGFTLTEMLAVVAILLVLGAMAVPVYTERVENSRRATALSETRSLAEAEEMVAMIHGFFVPLQVLDDVKEVTGVNNTLSERDTIDRDADLSLFVIDPNQSLARQDGDQFVLDENSDSARVREMINFWQGPFAKTKRVFIAGEENDDPENLNSTLVLRDFPLDPWGQPYRFYSPLGLIGSSAGVTDLSGINNDSFSDGNLTQQDRRFDRYAIVSFGRDGESDTETNSADDIIYQFGQVVSETTLNLF